MRLLDSLIYLCVTDAQHDGIHSIARPASAKQWRWKTRRQSTTPGNTAELWRAHAIAASAISELMQATCLFKKKYDAAARPVSDLWCPPPARRHRQASTAPLGGPCFWQCTQTPPG